MSRKTYLFTLLLIILVATTAFADVQIGDEMMIDQSMPMDLFYGYTYSQVIYPQDAIMVDGDITAIKYQYNISTADFLVDNNNLVIWMGHTTKTQFDTTTDWVDVAELTQVFAGDWAIEDFDNGIPGTGWVTITLDTPFSYNNTDNLLIAFDENAPSYASSADDFYASASNVAQGLIYRNDTTNPDPLTPPAGALRNSFANIVLVGITYEGNPGVAFNPTPADGAVDIAAPVTLGWSCYFADYYDVYFDGALVADDITDRFYVVEDLDYSTTYQWYVEAFNANGSTVGTTWSFTLMDDPTITEFPYVQGFDTVVEPELPNDWYSIVETENTYAMVGSDDYNPYSAPNHAKLYNSSAVGPDELLLISPLCTADISTSRARFMAKGGTNYELQVGLMTDPTDVATFTLVETVYPTSDYAEFIVDLSASTLTEGHVAFRHPMANTYRSLYVDDFTWEEIPAGAPLAAINPSPADMEEFISVDPQLSWDWDTGGMEPTGYQVYMDTNPTPTTMVYDGADNFFAATSLDEFTTYYWQVVPYNAEGSAVDCPVWSFTTLDPATLIVIGDGAEFNQHLPIEPYYGYTYSQVIYLAEEMGGDAKIINSISYHYNGTFPDQDNNDLVVYMANTTQTEFADWMPVTELTQVFDGTWEIIPGDGWVTIDLDTPFIYNGIDNLVVAVDENRPGFSDSNDEFYCTAVTGNRGIRYYNDSVNPDPYDLSSTSGTVSAYIANIRLHVEDPEYGNLEGYVTDTDTGAFLEGAVVDCGGYTATTDAAGYYYIADIVTGTYDVTATHPEYVPGMETVEILVDQTVEQDFALTFYYPPQISVTPTSFDFAFSLNDMFADSSTLFIENPGVDWLNVTLETADVEVERGADILVWNPSTGDSEMSGLFFQTWLEDNGHNVTYHTTSITSYTIDDLAEFDMIFACFGIYNMGRYAINADEKALCEAFLDLGEGKAMYAEGGDFWAYDSINFEDYFSINGAADGSGDLATVEGIAGTPFEGYAGNYTGANNYIDHIEAVAPAYNALQANGGAYNTGVAFYNETVDYYTFGASFLLGGMDNADVLMETMMDEHFSSLGSADWLVVNPTEGSIFGGDTGEFQVIVSAGPGVLAGDYNGIVLVHHNVEGEINPIEIPVTATLTGGAADPYVMPDAIANTLQAGALWWETATDVVEIGNGEMGKRLMGWEITSTLPAWLTADMDSNVDLGPGDSDDVTFVTDPEGLAAGSYSADVTFHWMDGENEGDFTVTFSVEVMNPGMVIDPMSFAFELDITDGPFEASDIMTITNDGNGDLNLELATSYANRALRVKELRSVDKLHTASKVSSKATPTRALNPEAGLSPYAPAPTKSNEPVVTLNRGSLAYGVDVYPGANDFLTFDTEAPDVFTTIASLPFSDFPSGGDYDAENEDFMYMVVYGTGAFYKTYTDGTTESIGTTTPVSDLACDKSTNTMYGINGTELYTIDLETGDYTLIGDTGTGYIISMAAADGMLYGLDMDNDQIHIIDPATAEATVLGACGFDAAYAQSMGYDPESDEIYLAAYAGAGEFRMMDRETGNCELIGGLQGGAEMECLAFPGGAGGTGNWLTVTPTTATIPDGGAYEEFTVTAALGEGALAGEFMGYVEISHNDPDTDVPVMIPVTLGVTGGYTDPNVWPEEFSAYLLSGEEKVDWFWVGNATAATALMNWDITIEPASATWITADPMNDGGEPVEPGDAEKVILNIDAEGLEPGIYTAEINVNYEGYEDDDFGTVTTTYSLEVYNPNIVVDPAYMQFSIDMQGESIVDSQYLNIANSGTGPLYVELDTEIQTRSAARVKELRSENDVHKASKVASKVVAPARTLNPEAGLSPYAPAPSKTNEPVVRLNRGSLAYGVDVYPGNNDFVTFDTEAPDVFTNITSLPFSDFPSGGDFDAENDDFMYMVVYGTGAFYKTYTDGTTEQIGTTTPVSDLACDKSANIMYGIDGTSLYTIDMETGDYELIGDTGTGYIISMACADGMLYGLDMDNDQIQLIDPETAEATVLGPCGFDAAYAQSMGYDPETDEIYLAAYAGSGEFRMMDRETGNCELIGGLQGGAEMDCLAFPGGAGAANFLSAYFTVPENQEVVIWENQDIDATVKVDAHGQVGGTYYGVIYLDHNDPETENPLEVAVQISLTNVTAIPNFWPVEYGETLMAGEDMYTLFWVGNDTDASAMLDWNIDVEYMNGADWLTVDPDEGNSVYPGDAERVLLHLDAEGLDTGTYVAVMHVNWWDIDGNNGTEDVFVGMEVYNPDIDYTPNAFNFTLNYEDGTVQDSLPLTITNNGSGPLMIELDVDAQTRGTSFLSTSSKSKETSVSRVVSKQKANIIPRSAIKVVPNTGLAPTRAAVSKTNEPTVRLNTRSMAYGVDVYPGANDFVTFDTASPDVFTNITSLPFSDFPSGGDFDAVNQDFMYMVVYGTGEFYKSYIDGSTELIGTTTVVSDLACDKATNIMYGIDGTSLYTIDMETGDYELIGDTGTGYIISMAAADGVLYGLDMDNDQIHIIDPATAEATLLGACGFDAAYAQSMGYDPDSDEVYLAAYAGAGEFRMLDRETGNCELIGGLQGGAEMDCLAFPGGSGGNWLWVNPEEGIAYPDDPFVSMVHVDANPIVSGIWYGAVNINHNDPDTDSPINVPVILEVGGGVIVPYVELVNEEDAYQYMLAGTSKTVELLVGNDESANALLAYTIEETPADAPWLTVEPTEGEGMWPGFDESIDLTFDASGMEVGTNTVTLHVTCSGYDVSDVHEFDVILTLEVFNPDIAISPEMFNVTIDLGDTMELPLAITNNGVGPLEWAADTEEQRHEFAFAPSRAWIEKTRQERAASVLVWNPATGNSEVSGLFFQTWLEDDGADVTYETGSITAYTIDALEDFDMIFACFGIYGNGNYGMNADEQALCQAYLDLGGKAMYAEGGDFWAYDTINLEAYFNINGLTDGSGDLATVEGVAGTDWEGYTGNYTGANNYIDHIEAVDPAVNALQANGGAYFTGVAYYNEEADYTTFGASFLLGGMDNADELMELMMDTQFSLSGGWLTVAPEVGMVWPNNTQETTVKFDAREVWAGTYYGNIMIESNDPENELIEVPVVMNVTGGEAIGNIWPMEVVDYLQNGEENLHWLWVENETSATALMEWTLTDDADWLECTPNEGSGMEPGDRELIECVITAPAEEGIYTANIDIHWWGGDTADETETITVVLEVYDPAIEVTPTFFNFYGNLDPEDPDYQMEDSTEMVITNTGSGPLMVEIDAITQNRELRVKNLTSANDLHKASKVASKVTTPARVLNPEAGLSPHAPVVSTSKQPVVRLNNRSMAYGVDVYPGANDFVTFQTEAPDVFTNITSLPFSDFPSGGDFDGDNDDFMYMVVYGTGAFYKAYIDGTTEQIGTTTPVSDLACNKAEGIMYGIDGTSLYTINMETGDYELIGDTGTGYIISMACDADGILYGLDMDNDQIHMIDGETAEATLLGACGFDAAYAQSMGYDPETDEVYLAAYAGSGEFRMLDRETGNCELIGGLQGGAEMDCLAFPGSAGAKWLSVTPEAAQIFPEEPGNFMVKAQCYGIPAGIYYGTVSINHNDSDADNPMDIPVIYTVEGGYIDPDVTPDLYDVQVVEGTGPVTETLYLINGPEATALMAWDITEDPEQDWLTLSETEGAQVGIDKTVEVTLTFDPTDLAPGTYSTELTTHCYGSEEGDDYNFTSYVYFSVFNPDISVDPADGFIGDNTFVVEPGETTDGTLTIANDGEGTLYCELDASTVDRISVRASKRATDTSVRSANASKTVSAPAVSKMAANPEAGLSPNAPVLAASKEPVVRLNSRSMAYGVDAYPGNNDFVSFDTDAPGSFTQIISLPFSDFPSGGDFDAENEDFMYMVVYGTGAFYKVYLDGSSEQIGTTTTVSDLACDKATNTMYGIDGTSLYTIDLETGDYTLIGDTGTGYIISMAAADGMLYGLDMDNDQIHIIDPATAEATVLGACGFDAAYAQSMGYDPENDEIYLAAYVNNGSGELRVMDRETGNCELIGQLQAGAEVECLAFPGDGYTWLSIDTEMIEVEAGETGAINVHIDATELEVGSYWGEIAIEHNDPDVDNPLILPVHLIVQDEGFVLGVTPTEVYLGTHDPSPNDQWLDPVILTLTNFGDEAGNWTANWAEDWMIVDPASGSLDVSESVEIAVQVNTGNNLTPGMIHSDNLIFTGGVSPEPPVSQIWFELNPMPFPPDHLEAQWVEVNEDDHDISLTWWYEDGTPDGVVGYQIFRKIDDEEWPMVPYFATNNPELDTWTDEDVPGSEVQWTEIFYAMKSVVAGQGPSALSDPVSLFKVDDIIDNWTDVPEGFQVSGNYPNPFNPTTSFEYGIPEAAQVTIRVYDAQGNLVKTLEDGVKEAGYHTATWNGTNEAGNEVSSGIYFYTVQSGNNSQTSRMILMK